MLSNRLAETNIMYFDSTRVYNTSKLLFSFSGKMRDLSNAIKFEMRRQEKARLH